MRVGLLGAGGITGAHLAGYRACSDIASVVAIADARREAAEKRSAEIGGAQVFTDWRELLRHADVDAVDICLPHDLHCEAAVSAAQSGRHVLVEKPIARTLAEADAMIDAAERAGVKLMVSHDRRYHPLFAKAKSLIDEGAVGRVLLARFDHNQNLNLAPAHWIREKRRLGGGAVVSCLVHQIDLMLWMFGPVAQVGGMSLTLPERMEGEVVGIVPMRFRSGALGEAVINWAVRGTAPQNGLWYELMWVSGDRGNLHNLGGLYTMRYDLGGDYAKVETGADAARGGHSGAIRHFVECVAADKQPLTSGRDARAALEVAIAAYQAEAEGRFVDLPLREPYFSAHAD